jgi:hypothetical protein
MDLGNCGGGHCLQLVAPNYFLIKQNASLLRFNKASGALEELGEKEWIHIAGDKDCLSQVKNRRISGTAPFIMTIIY